MSGQRHREPAEIGREKLAQALDLRKRCNQKVAVLGVEVARVVEERAEFCGDVVRHPPSIAGSASVVAKHGEALDILIGEDDGAPLAKGLAHSSPHARCCDLATGDALAVEHEGAQRVAGRLVVDDTDLRRSADPRAEPGLVALLEDLDRHIVAGVRLGARPCGDGNDKRHSSGKNSDEQVASSHAGSIA